MTEMKPIAPGHARQDRHVLRPVMLTSQFLPEVFGGAEQQCRRLSRELVRLGHRPHILTSRSDPATPARSIEDGVHVTRILTAHPPQLGGRHLGSTLLWMSQIGRWFEENRHDVDLIHCHQAKLNAWIGVRCARRLGIPCLVKPGSAGANFDLAGLAGKRFVYGRLAAREIVRHVDRFISISHEMAADLRAFGVEKSRIVQIPNGIAEGRSEWRAPVTRADLGIPAPAELLVFCGRLEDQKNVETLLRAVGLSTPRCHLMILGCGTRLARLRGLAAELAIAERCHFIGRVDDPRAWMTLADVFVLPARAEGMSNALLEAMSIGLVPVASRVSGNTDLIEDRVNGFLYDPPDDPIALARAIESALALDPDRRKALGGAARTKVLRDHSLPGIAARYAALYETLIPAQVA